ncbi:MAG: DUF465 domain-containing protein [Gammaproteobacteria bacterium]|nr:DUF465 domain-containing protein [Gammaproteobacteria bacterium]
MFDYDQDIVKSLLHESIEFKRLYDKHSRLKQQVYEAQTSNVDFDDFALEKLKKEKLYLKDRMAGMIEDYKRSHAAA